MATTQKRYFPRTNAELKELVKDENIHLGEIDVSGVEDMSLVFSHAEISEDGDVQIFGYEDFERQNFEGLETWDVSRVKNMKGMFAGVKHFNHDISSWDVSNVTDMSWMFYGCRTFNQPLDKWDVFGVTNMRGMFFSTNFNQPLENWDVSNVVNMEIMFSDCKNFNQSLDDWDVSRVTNMKKMFAKCHAYGELPKWCEKKWNQ